MTGSEWGLSRNKELRPYSNEIVGTTGRTSNDSNRPAESRIKIVWKRGKRERGGGGTV